jgi:hypothetical protein
MRVGGQLHSPAALPPGKRPGTHYIGGWVWTAVENLAPTWIRSPDRPARSGLLYRLIYPKNKYTVVICMLTRTSCFKMRQNVEEHKAANSPLRVYFKRYVGITCIYSHIFMHIHTHICMCRY